MEVYLDLLQRVIDQGEVQKDRTGVGTLSLFGAQMHIDISQSFPLLTTKKVFFSGIVHELLWFLKGDNNIHYLNEHNVHIWDAWADKEGNLGPVYGVQWRRWKNYDGTTIDQIANVIKEIQSNPSSRRLIVNAWNVAEVSKMALPPCHTLFQFHVSANQELSCQLYQRSGDLFLGVPFNIASYALLTYLIAQVCHLKPKTFVHTLGDAHIYLNHLEQAKTQLTRKPLRLPQLELNPKITDINEFRFEDIKLPNYVSHERITAPIAI